jgi:hypothetical protein
MRRLMEYRQEAGTDIFASFVHGKVFVAVPSQHRFFEPAMFRPVNPECCYRLFKDVLLALDIVEELNLNTRISSKQ